MRNVWPSSPPLDLQVTKQTPAHSLLYTDWTNQVAKLQSCDIKVLLHLGHCCLQSQLQERATWSPITIKYLDHLLRISLVLKTKVVLQLTIILVID